MPVGMLLCEGLPGGPDVTLLSRLCLGLSVQVQPVRGKYGMKNQILMHRDTRGVSQIYGIRDRDFDGTWQPPADRPVSWLEEVDHQAVHIGWTWERKEIENYLIDPAVVFPLLGKKIQDQAAYTAGLLAARDALVHYQAARMALSAARPSTRRLENEFRKSDVDALIGLSTEEQRISRCRELMQACAHDFRQSNTLNDDALLSAFEQVYLPQCSPDGLRYQHYLTAFSGKDLLRRMTPVLADQGFKSASVFIATIKQAITEYEGTLTDLLPEWAALRHLLSDA